MNNAWVDEFVKLWNLSAYRASLTQLGIIQFNVLDDPPFCFVIHWTEDGSAIRLSVSTRYDYRLDADRNTWDAFFRGAFTASQAVMDGRFTFEGDFRSIAPYSKQINSIAIVANRVTAIPA